MSRTLLFPFLVLCLGFSTLPASGGYDHGTATGRGQLELDFTWNPLNLFEQGQSYIVFGYGLTDRLDFHGYFSHHPSGPDNYYYGLFYQFMKTDMLDLATAIGIRQYRQKKPVHLFFPQILYNVKLGEGYTIGGSVVTIQTIKYDKPGRLGMTADVAVFIPLTKWFEKVRGIEEVKLGIGVFRPVLWKPKWGNWYPTYSVDVKFSLPRKQADKQEPR